MVYLAFPFQKKDEISQKKRNSVQLLRIDNSAYLEEFDTSTSIATPVSRRDETGSEGSRESSASGDSKAATKSLLNSSLISAQSDVVLRRQKDGLSSPYISTPVLPRAEEPDSVRLRSATHDVSAFRARHVRSEVFNDSDWSPGRLGRPRSMDALDKLPSSSSTLTPNDVDSGDGLPDGNGAGSSGKLLKQPGMKHLKPTASPSGMRKHYWTRSSPNISPVPPRKEYPVSLEPLPPSPPSTSVQRTSSPHSSPILARKLEEKPSPRTPQRSPIMGRKENGALSPSQRDARRASMPITQYTQNLDTIPVRERAVEPTKSKISVQVIAAANTPNGSSPSLTNKSVSSPFQEDQARRVTVERRENSPQAREGALVFNGGITSPYQERERNFGGDKREEPTTSTPRGFQRQESLRGDKNIKKGMEPSRNYSTLPSRSKQTRERSASGEQNGGKLIESPRNYNAVPSHVQHVREKSSDGDTSDGPKVIYVNDSPNRDTSQTSSAHSRERSLSGDRNEGLRASKRQGTIFAASTAPPLQSVPVTAHYVTSGTIPKSEASPSAAVSTAGAGTSVYVDASGVDLSSTPVVSRGNRAEVTSSSVFAIVRNKRGDERVLPLSNNKLPSRDSITPSRDHTTPSRASATHDSRLLLNSNTAVLRNTVSADTNMPSRYGTAPSPPNVVPSNPVELKPSANEQRDENRNDTKVIVSSGTIQETTKQNVSSERARLLEIEHTSPADNGSIASTYVQPSSQTLAEDNDDDARSVSSHRSRDCSPALKKVRKARKAAKEKEIFMDSPPALPDDSSMASGRRSGAEERARTRSVGSNPGDGKKSSVWYEYGCV